MFIPPSGSVNADVLEPRLNGTINKCGLDFLRSNSLEILLGNDLSGGEKEKKSVKCCLKCCEGATCFLVAFFFHLSERSVLLGGTCVCMRHN